MAGIHYEEILKIPCWSRIRESFSHHSPIQLPILSQGVLSGSFGDLFAKDLHRIKKQWHNRSAIMDRLKGSQIGLFLTAPIIWSVAIPLVLLDLVATLYQTICFPIYGIPTVDRGEFVVIDRHKLSYLDWLEKLNCVYCGYGNGVLAYVREIASRTEERWCPIKHCKTPKDPHSRYAGFSDYGDRNGFLMKETQRKRHERRR